MSIAISFLKNDVFLLNLNNTLITIVLQIYLNESGYSIWLPKNKLTPEKIIIFFYSFDLYLDKFGIVVI